MKHSTSVFSLLSSRIHVSVLLSSIHVVVAGDGFHDAECCAGVEAATARAALLIGAAALLMARATSFFVARIGDVPHRARCSGKCPSCQQHGHGATWSEETGQRPPGRRCFRGAWNWTQRAAVLWVATAARSVVVSR